MLHMCNVGIYASALQPAFTHIAIMIQVSPPKSPTWLYTDIDMLPQDPCFQIRLVFLEKLIALLTARKLPPYFNVIPFLTVHDPEPETKNKVSAVGFHT